MENRRNVAVLVGSLRSGSINRQMAQALEGLAPPRLALGIVEIGALPLYNQDADTDAPPVPWAAFRQAIRQSDAVLFVTPEYNRSVPGVLKNAIDVGSRPAGRSAFARKPAAIVSVTQGAFGAFGANHHLRQSLVFLDMPTLQQPEAYIPRAAQLFDAQGRLVTEDMKAVLQKVLQAFADWIERTRTP